MTTFLLIRHATHAVVGAVLVGRTPGIHLSDVGRQQAAALAERLADVPLAAVVSSPLERARQTAQPIAQRCGVTVQIDGAWNEIDVGDWTGRRFAELDDDPQWQRWNRFRSTTRPPAGESMIAVQARAVAALLALRDSYADAAVAIVSHCDVLRAVLAHGLAMPLDALLRLDVQPASVSVLTLDADWVQVRLINGHVDGLMW